MNKFYAALDASGLPVGFYTSEIFPDVVTYGPAPDPTEEDPLPVAPELSRARNSAIPAGAVEITAEQWQEFLQHQGERRWDGTGVVAFVPAPRAATVPDGPTLSDWRVAVTLWGRMADMTAKVAALVGSSDAATAMTGAIANERLQYANNVFRAELLALKDAFGFSAADVDESLWRADRVRKGDLSGVWPVAS